jgi:diguanylate cyclase (GGDEF)-like protein/PAS domain S-box-containing protein
VREGLTTADDDAPRCVLVRNEAALIVAVDGDPQAVLGWRADELIGVPSTTFIHPEDQPSAVAAWFQMISEPGATKTWRGRYRDGDGTWRWVEATNTNRLDDPNDPRVLSSITRVTIDQVSVEEELRARKQLLSRLADALPVGLFQIDLDGHVTFTNDRLHAIIDAAPAAIAAAQFASVLDEDRERFDSALSSALRDHAVDDLEIRFLLAPPEGEPVTRVCMISLRSLTDSDGTVTGAIGCVSDVTERARLRRELQIRASVDALTGCLNRAATLELLELLLDEGARAADGLAVVYVDLDDFKHVNDRYGHAAGDAVLVAAIERMQAVLRRDDKVGRLGGDEFLVVCPSVTNELVARELADRVRGALQTTVRVDGTDIALRATTGLAFAQHETSADALIAAADAAMYRSKAGSRTARAS